MQDSAKVGGGVVWIVSSARWSGVGYYKVEWYGIV